MIIPIFENKEIELELKQKLEQPYLKENISFPFIQFGNIEDLEKSPNSIVVSDSEKSRIYNISKQDNQDTVFLFISSKIHSELENEKNNNCVFFGTSKFNKNQANIAKSKELRVFSAKEISFEGLRDVCDAAMANLRASGKQFCLSLNLDVLDKSYHEKGTIGGLTPRQLIYALQYD